MGAPIRKLCLGTGKLSKEAYHDHRRETSPLRFFKRNYRRKVFAGRKATAPPPAGPHLPIHEAAGIGELETVQVLLTADPSLVSAKDDGGTPLHWAASHGHKQLLELLLAHGADINAEDPNGATPLHLAAFVGLGNIAELLLANGADVNARDNWSRTPLQSAGLRGHRDVQDLLRRHGATG